MPDEGKKKEMESFFLKLRKFKEPEYIICKTPEEVENNSIPENADLIVFYDQLEKYIETVRDTIFKKYIEQKDGKKNRLFVFYGQKSQTKNEYNQIVTAANSELTLYTRIMEALIFQEDIKTAKTNYNELRGLV